MTLSASPNKSPLKTAKMSLEPSTAALKPARNTVTYGRPATAQPRTSQNPVKNTLGVPPESKYNNYTSQDRNPDNLNSQNVEINSLKEIIAAQNQKLRKTDDIQEELA